MAALPYMPLYVADYLADAGHLTPSQHGAYLLLLMNYWQRGAPLPNDDAKLARIARMNNREWARNRAVLVDFFATDGTLLIHKRVEAELSRVATKSLKAKAAASASVQRRFNGRSADAERTLNHTDTDTSKKVPLPKEGNGATPDSDKAFWDTAKAYLGAKNAGMIGKWVKAHGKDETARAITAAQIERAVEPIEYIQGYFRNHGDDGTWGGLVGGPC